jgi:GT2 family glycosyltransferase
MVDSLVASLPAGLSYEVILVDDGSTDGTREWLATLRAPFHVLLNPRNLGYAASNNRGAAAAQGRMLAFLNNDLVLSGGWLQPMISALEALGARAGMVGNVQVAAATGDVDHSGIWVTENGKTEHDRRAPGLLARLLEPEPAVFAVTGACMLVRAQAWRRLGGFDEGFSNGCEDVDLCLRAGRLGLINVVALRSRVLHHVSSSPGRKDRDEQNAMRLVMRWRPELALASSRRWAWAYFRRRAPQPRSFGSVAQAIHFALYLMHMSPSPPEPILEARYGAIELEFARWRVMFAD